MSALPTKSTVQNVAAMMYLAGTDSLVAVLSTFILGMLANPDAQNKAQLEIDSVVGRGNLPDFNDEEGMPYVAALVKEVLRWKSVGPFGSFPFYSFEAPAKLWIDPLPAMQALLTV